MLTHTPKTTDLRIDSLAYGQVLVYALTSTLAALERDIQRPNASEEPADRLAQCVLLLEDIRAQCLAQVAALHRQREAATYDATPQAAEVVH